jgi:hypothetical protein
MESEQSQNFNDRLSQWVGSQGFWFQVRYSVSGTGMRGRTMFHLLRIVVRILIFLLLVALGIWIYLIKRPDSPRFGAAFKQSLTRAITASDLEIKSLNHRQGKLEISRVAARGGKETFFTSLEARNIRCNMGLVDGLAGKWTPGVISISRLEIDIRAGSDDAASASKLADAWFRKSASVEVNSFEVQEATVRWGFSERTRGSIEKSQLKMLRTNDGWRMVFKGGKFHQNWLSNLDIVDLVVHCDPNGLVFEKAELKQGEGTVNFTGLRVISGERPQVSGTAEVTNLDLWQILQPAFHTFVEGKISGKFKVSGSTNSTEGVGFEGQVVMDGKNSVSLRERMHLLKALSVLDYSRNYHRVDFSEGSFDLKTTNGGMEITNAKLLANELFTLEGKMSVRLPTQEEIQTATAKGTAFESSPLFIAEDEAAKLGGTTKSESDFNLKRAGQEARRIKEGDQSLESLSLFDRMNVSAEMRHLQAQEAERMSRMLRYQGQFQITIQKDAFERAPKLQALYPVDPNTGRIAMRVPIEGSLYELTLKQAEDIYILGQR